MSEPKLIVAALVRNEASRFWRSALEAWSTFADEIIVADDASTDDTAEIARDAGAHVFPLGGDPAWGNESAKRKYLFTIAAGSAQEGDYILLLDADMVPARDPRPLLQASPEAVAFPLYDLWGQDEDGYLLYRADSFWQGHLHPRIWLIRRPETPPEGWEWNQRGIHCGHLPANFHPERVLIAPREYGLLHYAYHSADLREAKAAQYEAVAGQLSDFERAHARSILDAKPVLFRLPFEAELKLGKAS